MYVRYGVDGASIFCKYWHTVEAKSEEEGFQGLLVFHSHLTFCVYLTTSHSTYETDEENDEETAYSDRLTEKYGHVIEKYGHVIEKYGHVIDQYDHVIEKYDHVIEKYGHVIEKYGHMIEKYGHVIEQYGHVIEKYGHVIECLPDEKFMPPIGNGHIATNVLSDTIYMNGFYNGYREDSHRARLQATSAVDVQFNDDRESRYYALDMFNGIFYQKIYHPTQNTSITIMYFAHRKYDTLLVTHVSVQQILPSNISFICSKGGLSQDIGNSSEVKVDNSTTYWSGENKRPETDDLEPMRFHHVWTKKVNVSEDYINDTYRSNWISITSIGTDKEEVFSLYRKALEMTHDNLVNQHKQEWNRIWKKGHIEIHGDDKELQRNIHAAFYNILSSLPQKQNVHNPFIGLSPGGLSRGGKINPNKTGGPSNNYAGHVFWDMDTWIMPPIMMFHPNLARLMINSRIRVLDTAKKNAKGTGYLGARFPWEQAVTGIDTCPWDLASKYQVHVTADVSYALRQYLYVSSKDAAIEMLTNGGSSLALEIAKFWESRVNKTDDRNDILG
ncbi:Hypothetical predicted protein [Mytilus galloprovincialis]|uniref:Glycoside hydrolase family 65 central catalytic domain-containing protein n=1 Tax=Mytilus galloprovincialis TaxID=29158 RepID=A0A8B6E762_MYTGA|nr:Hypothetical predicted protein [Mytilus galloprovincialis]